MLTKKDGANNDASISNTSDTLSENVSNKKPSNSFMDYKTLKEKGILVAEPIRGMRDRVRKLPPLKRIYSGIIENSMGFVFGPSKSAKTTICEGLGLSIAAGKKEFLGSPIDIDNRKVLFISLEEDFRPRTERNDKQIEALIKEIGNDEWLDNYIVINENMPQNVHNDAEWQFLNDLIMDVNPGILFIDSLTHLYHGVIEESSMGKFVMQRVKQLPRVTTVIIHHTPKQMGRPLTQDSLAGSRVLAGEAEFMIGINKTFDGRQRYIKDVAFRYNRENSDTVKLFEIDDNQWVRLIKECDESDLLTDTDNRYDNSNRIVLLDYISANAIEGRVVDSNTLLEAFVKTGKMSKATMFNSLKTLARERKIERSERGEYKKAA